MSGGPRTSYKPLRWSVVSDFSGWEKIWTGSSDVRLGEYEITSLGDEWHYEGRSYSDLETAKEAAQREYEAGMNYAFQVSPSSIEALEKENARLRAAIKELWSLNADFGHAIPHDPDLEENPVAERLEDIRGDMSIICMRALKGEI